MLKGNSSSITFLVNALISVLINSAQPYRISLPCYFLSLSLIEIKIQKKQTEISSDLAGG